MAINTEQLGKQGSYEAKVPLPSVLGDLDQILRIIQERQAFRKKLRLYAGLCLVIGIVVGITAATINNGLLFGFVSFPAFVACLALFIYSFVYSNQMLKHRNRCDLLKQLAASVQQDAGGNAAFSVRLALANSSKLVSEAPWDQRKNGKQQFFEDQWIALEGRLLDGTALTESVTELMRKRSFTNPRGKHKTKTRSRYLLNLCFDYPADLYGDPRLVRQQPEDIRVPASANVKDVRVTDQSIAVKAMVLDPEEIMQTSAMLSLAVYQILKSSRRLASQGGAR